MWNIDLERSNDVLISVEFNGLKSDDEKWSNLQQYYRQRCDNFIRERYLF